MAARKMHADEVDIDISLPRALLTAQFPQWSGLALAPVASAGTDHALYRLGDDMVVRVPRINWAVGQIDKEHLWLPRLAPKLPISVPMPLAVGEPMLGYPWRWGVYRWIDGHDATIHRMRDPRETARQTAQFVVALRKIHPTGGPLAGEHNFGRGVPLANRDQATRAAIDALRGAIDADAAAAAWQAALATPVWLDAPVWIHGDLQAGNLLLKDGRLTAIIDFGALGVGDPACDLMIAWNLFTGPARQAFREGVCVDDATWSRGRGWALSVGLIALPYYRDSNPTLAGIARFTIDQVLADFNGA